MIGIEELAPPTTFERRLGTGYARDRLAKALYEIVLDGTAYGPRDLMTAGDREWIRGAIAVAIQEATEVALHDLAGRLVVALDRTPDGSMPGSGSSNAGDELSWVLTVTT